MATNLRLRPATADALRRRAEQSGRSQQEIIREALERYLGLDIPPVQDATADVIARGVIRPPRTPYRRVTQRLSLPEGMTSLDLLDREDRI